MAQEWLSILGAAVGLIGASVVLRALFADRSRGRRRCPGCWYDMSRVPGVRCPECGRTTKKERGLLRTRRRWRRAAIGMCLVVLGAATVAAPSVREHGWLSIIPTAVLVHFTPTIEEEDATTDRLLEVAKELRRRFDTEGFSDGQWRVIIERSHAIRTRDKWPIDRELAIELRVPRWVQSNCGLRATPRLSGASSVFAEHMIFNGYAGPYGQPSLRPVGILAPETTSVVFDVEVWVSKGIILWPNLDRPADRTIAVRAPVEAVETPDAAITPVDSKEATEAVRRALSLRAMPMGPELAIEVQLDRSQLASFTNLSVSLEFSAMRIGGEAGEPERVFACDLSPGSQRYCYLREISNAAARDPVTRELWCVRVRGAPEGALIDWEKDSYWSGEFVVPLREIMDEAGE